MDKQQEEIIEKIRKMMALAERAGTEGEADAAMHKVQELLTKYNLDADQIKDKTEEAFTREYKEYEWNQSWIKTTWSGIAKLYFCHIYFEQNGLKSFKINVIGKPVNIATAMYVAEAVINNGKLLARLYAQEQRKEWGLNPVSCSNNFKKGYAVRIQQRCNEMIREYTTANKTPGQGLVVADFYRRNLAEINKYERDVLGLRLRAGAGMASGDAGHMASGASAANGVSLRASGIGQRRGVNLLA